MGASYAFVVLERQIIVIFILTGDLRIQKRDVGVKKHLLIRAYDDIDITLHALTYVSILLRRIKKRRWFLTFKLFEES